MDSLYSTMNHSALKANTYHSKSGLLSKLVSKTASLLELLHVNLVVPRLPSAMKSNAVLFLFIMANRGGTRLITVKAFIRLIDTIVAANQAS